MENNEIKKEIAQVVDDFEKALKERDKQEAFKIEGHLTQEQIDGIKDSMKITNQMEQALRYNNGKPQWSLVDFDSLEGLVHVLEYGARKYAKDNWKKGMPVTQVSESLMRHLFAFLRGEDVDPESGCRHISHVMCNTMFLEYILREKPHYDDRKGENKVL
jgi:hypothetical protein